MRADADVDPPLDWEPVTGSDLDGAPIEGFRIDLDATFGAVDTPLPRRRRSSSDTGPAGERPAAGEPRPALTSPPVLTSRELFDRDEIRPAPAHAPVGAAEHAAPRTVPPDGPLMPRLPDVVPATTSVDLAEDERPVSAAEVRQFRVAQQRSVRRDNQGRVLGRVLIAIMVVFGSVAVALVFGGGYLFPATTADVERLVLGPDFDDQAPIWRALGVAGPALDASGAAATLLGEIGDAAGATPAGAYAGALIVPGRISAGITVGAPPVGLPLPLQFDLRAPDPAGAPGADPIAAAPVPRDGDSVHGEVVAWGADDWTLVWAARLPAAQVDAMVAGLAADALLTVDRGARRCVVANLTVSAPDRIGEFASGLTAWTERLPAAAMATVSIVDAVTLGVDACDPGPAARLGDPAAVDAVLDRVGAPVSP